MDETANLRDEIEKIRSQFYIFYELSQAMRTTLRLDEIVYIILTGITARQGLAFNRAILFLINTKNQSIDGFMGIGPIDAEEANKIWMLIEEQKMDLYALMENYRRIKEGAIKPKLMDLVQSLHFPLNEQAGILFDVLYEISPLHIKRSSLDKYKKDPLVQKLKLDEFIIAPLCSKNIPLGIVIVDNPITKKPVTDADLRILTMFIHQATGALENSKTYEDTLMLAHTDMLTSLWNYGYFQYKLDEELLKAEAQNYSVSVIMLDIDDFKKFNDAFGHQEGDKALKRMGDTLKSCSRKIDIVCRYGGEEFSLILPHTTKQDALSTAERIRISCEEQEINGRKLTVSVGIASFPHDATSKQDLIKKADLALYRAKSEGKNRVILT